MMIWHKLMLRFYLAIMVILLGTNIACANDNILEIDSNLRRNGPQNLSDTCFSSGKIILDATELDQAYTPDELSEAALALFNSNNAGAVITVVSMAVVRVVVYQSLLDTGPIGMLIAGIAMAIDLTMMFDQCTNAFILAPHEIFNQAANCLKCAPFDSTAGYLYYYSHAYGPEDIPYRFHCNTCTCNNLYTRGYGDYFDTRLCGLYANNSGNNGAVNLQSLGWTDTASIKQIRLCYKTYLAKSIVMDPNYAYCDTDNGYGNNSSHSFPGNNSSNCTDYGEGLTLPYAVYYRANPASGQIQMCIANVMTIFPVMVGCSGVAPPVDMTPYDQGLETYLSQTRCRYLLDGRNDLNSLGATTPFLDATGRNNEPMGQFLQSDFHIFSTATGCVTDMINKVFFTVQAGNNLAFYQELQNSMAPVVYATFALYIALFGIKIMTAGQGMPMKDWIMPIIKLAIVYALALGNIWGPAPGGASNSGLYNNLITISDSIVSIFTGAAAQLDIVGHCSFIWNDGSGNAMELLSTRTMSATAPSMYLSACAAPAGPGSGTCTCSSTNCPDGSTASCGISASNTTAGVSISTIPTTCASTTATTTPTAPACCTGGANPFSGSSTSIATGTPPPVTGYTCTGSACPCGNPTGAPVSASSYKISSLASPQGCPPDSANGAVCKSLKYETYAGSNPYLDGSGNAVVLGTEGSMGTGNSCVVTMTAFDMVDCKLATYLNMGMCKYDIASLIMLWIFPISIFSSDGFMLALTSFVFLFIMLGMIIRFTIITIMCWFAILLLTLTAPLFALFYLFEATKEAFMMWLKFIIGFVIYPGLLFAYLGLIMVTLSFTMFGDLQDSLTAAGQTSFSVADLATYCPNTPSTVSNPLTTAQTTAYNSAICSTYRILGGNPCNIDSNAMQNSMFSQVSYILFNRTILNPQLATVYKQSFTKIMLFVIVFNLLSKGIIGFLAQLAGLAGLGFEHESAAFDVSASKIVGKIGSAYAKLGKAAIAKGKSVMSKNSSRL
jgi:hypothetical protein